MAGVYDGLIGADPHHAGAEGQWAFGTSFDDPLAGIDPSVPEGVDATVLAAYCRMLGDDALVAAHRLSEWCSRAPDLEEDVALANTALDLLGQARLLLARAAAADPSLVPALPEGSPVPAEDALAFFRDDHDFRNVRLVEAERGDFGETVARLLVLACWRLALLQRLVGSRDPVLAAVAAKAVKEVTYHRDWAGRWFLVLARGTEESRRRVEAGLARVWRGYDELFEPHDVERSAAAAGIGVDPSTVRAEVDAVLDQVLAAGGVERPRVAAMGRVAGGAGRDGRHTEALGRMLAEMQVVARAHPMGRW
jgi:ring-1,2-phenylacetyl-CoA epoxidase subunit PaaC